MYKPLNKHRGLTEAIEKAIKHLLQEWNTTSLPLIPILLFEDISGTVMFPCWFQALPTLDQ